MLGLGGYIKNLGLYPKNEEKEFQLSNDPSCIFKKISYGWIEHRACIGVRLQRI